MPLNHTLEMVETASFMLYIYRNQKKKKRKGREHVLVKAALGSPWRSLSRQGGGGACLVQQRHWKLGGRWEEPGRAVGQARLCREERTGTRWEGAGSTADSVHRGVCQEC